MSTLKLLHVIKLINGLTVTIYDHTKVYFGDYHHVRVKIICFIDDVIADSSQLNFDSIDPRKIAYTRTLEKMGVPSIEIDMVINDLLKDFKVNSLPYLSSPDFPRKLAEKELFRNKTAAVKYQGSVS